MIGAVLARPGGDRALHHDAVARHGVDHEAQFLRQDVAARARHAPGGEVQQDALHEQGIGCVRQQVAGRIGHAEQRRDKVEAALLQHVLDAGRHADLDVVARQADKLFRVTDVGVHEFQLPLHARGTGGDGVPEQA